MSLWQGSPDPVHPRLLPSGISSNENSSHCGTSHSSSPGFGLSIGKTGDLGARYPAPARFSFWADGLPGPTVPFSFQMDLGRQKSGAREGLSQEWPWGWADHIPRRTTSLASDTVFILLLPEAVRPWRAGPWPPSSLPPSAQALSKCLSSRWQTEPQATGCVFYQWPQDGSIHPAERHQLEKGGIWEGKPQHRGRLSMFPSIPAGTPASHHLPQILPSNTH